MHISMCLGRSRGGILMWMSMTTLILGLMSKAGKIIVTLG